MDDDWDLQAVVRGCTTAPSSTTATTTTTTTGGAVTSSVNDVNTGDFCTRSCFSSLSSGSFSGSFFSTSDPFETRNTNFAGDLHELYKPFFTKSYQLSQSEPISPFVVCKEQTPLKHHHQQLKQAQTGSVTSSASSHTPRSKRRKNQLKKICQVPAEAISSDVWAWRKYGQKPIKGSPYPRGYYRCSSSKGCLARKQVERNKSDPGMFIVTYTGEHNHPAPTHRNSLAGSTRQKTTTSQAVAAGDSGQPSPVKPTCSSSPATSVDDELLPVGTNTESREEKDVMEYGDEDEFVGFSDDVSDDFFEGLEELASPAASDKFSDHFTSNFGLPWLATSAATAATGL